MHRWHDAAFLATPAARGTRAGNGHNPMVSETTITARELRVYWMAKQGLSLEEIAFQLWSEGDEPVWLEEKQQCEAIDAVIESNILRAIAT